MANDSYTQQALANETSFRLRLQNAMTKHAFTVLDEDPVTPHHFERAAYARRVMANPTQEALNLSPTFVNRPNVINFDTSYDFKMREVVTASGDADIESQVATDWDILAGVQV